MKHARKMILVDAATHGGGSATASQKLNENIEPLTNAIKTLANSAEFNRTHFGPSTTIVSRLNNDLEQILERRDLDPTTKLKLYNQELKRFLFLHRQSDRKSNIAPTPTPTPATPLPVPDEPQENWNGTDFWWDNESMPDSETGAVGGYPREPVTFSTPPREPRFSESPISHMDIDPPRGIKRLKTKQPAQRVRKIPKLNLSQHAAPESKYQSNLPRTTPKHEILRRNPPQKRKQSFDYFEDWNRKKRKYE